MHKYIQVFVLLIILINLVACSSDSKVLDNVETTESLNKQLNELDYDKEMWPEVLIIEDKYKRIIDDVTSIELFNGSSGYKYVIEDDPTISKITEVVHGIDFHIAEDQSVKVGFRYMITFNNSKDEWFKITFGYGFSDNLSGSGEANNSPYYDVEDIGVIFERLEDIEKNLD